MILKEIYVTDFTTDSAIAFRKKLFYLAAKFPKDPIRVYIDSHGGDLEALATMVASMNQVRNEIHTIAIGKAMSAGAILLSYGDERYCDEHATVMIHGVQLFDLPDMGMDDFEINSKEIRRINKFWLTQFAKNCGITYTELNNLLKTQGKEIYMNAKQCKRFGLVEHTKLPKMELEGIIKNEKTRSSKA